MPHGFSRQIFCLAEAWRVCLFCHHLKAISVITFSVVRHQSRDSYELKASNKAMSSTSSYESDAAPARAVVLPVVAALAAAVI